MIAEELPALANDIDDRQAALRGCLAKLKPGEAKPGGGASGGSVRPGGSGESDEERRKRYAEIREKMGKMSEDQKNKMRKIMEKRMKENPNMSREERGQAFREAMEKASGGGK